jgi:serine/threonine protein kinase
VLLTDEGRACLCDFGLSNMFLEFHDTTFCTSSIGGNARWAAPEIYRITIDDVVPSATTQSDVYSLGSIMLEVRQSLCHSCPNAYILS